MNYESHTEGDSWASMISLNDIGKHNKLNRSSNWSSVSLDPNRGV